MRWFVRSIPGLSLLYVLVVVGFATIYSKFLAEDFSHSKLAEEPATDLKFARFTATLMQRMRDEPWAKFPDGAAGINGNRSAKSGSIWRPVRISDEYRASEHALVVDLQFDVPDNPKISFFVSNVGIFSEPVSWIPVEDGYDVDTIDLFVVPLDEPPKDSHFSELFSKHDFNLESGPSFMYRIRDSELVRQFQELHRVRDRISSEGFGRYLYVSIVNVTTLGLGDVVPITTAARIAVSLQAVVGLLLMGLLVSLFHSKLWSTNQGSQEPCGKAVVEEPPASVSDLEVSRMASGDKSELETGDSLAYVKDARSHSSDARLDG
ncbi:MAG: potassium channel family protein [Pseudomonadales bacterium]